MSVVTYFYDQFEDQKYVSVQAKCELDTAKEIAEVPKYSWAKAKLVQDFSDEIGPRCRTGQTAR